MRKICIAKIQTGIAMSDTSGYRWQNDGAHMTLLQLLEFKTEADRKAFAKACGSRSVLYLFHVARGHKRIGESLAINIERESKGAVRCEDLRPDVDWAYLRSTKAKRQRAA